MTDHEPRTIALKEWASAIQALAEGKQILLMRKGGIIEETRSFELKERAFYLYPTYEHQRSELLKLEHRHFVEESLQQWSPAQQTASIRLYAEVTDDLEITSQEQLDRLRDLQHNGASRIGVAANAANDLKHLRILARTWAGAVGV